VTIGNFLIFASTFFIAYGIWEIIYWKIVTKSYKKYLSSDDADKDITLLDHISRKYGNDLVLNILNLKAFKKFRKDHYYRLFVILKSMSGFILGIALTILYFSVKASEYSPYLTISL
jgi:hypothetical protein